MNKMKQKKILLVDDNAEIHKDFIKILKCNYRKVSDEEAILFSTKKPILPQQPPYEIHSAYKGQDAALLVKQSILKSEPYALAFVDMKMPNGWDGIETIKEIWKLDPNIQIVICSAYSEYSWEDFVQELGVSDNLLILKKPFEAIEINQLASALTKKWELIADLNNLVKDRTVELENLYSLTKTTLEATQEGIFAVGLDEQILMFNQKFLQLWGISEELICQEKLNDIFSFMAERLDDPVLFLKMMNDLRMEPKIKSSKEWNLKSGSTIELYTHPQYLHGKMIGIVYNFRDITERKMLEKQLFHQATHDDLTGLPNRALLIDRIIQALAHAKRFDLHVGILLIDLDSFKEVNDTYGNQIGDSLLKCLAKRLSEYVRSNDTVARLGGDKFVVVLASQRQESNFIDLLNKFSNLFSSPCIIDKQEFSLSASIGVSIFPKDGQDAESLLKNADAALYHAKKFGGNCFQFYLDEFNQHIVHRSELKIALAQALQKNELSLNYQPLIDLKNNQVMGMEALIRWEHPTMGIVSPLTFIPVAEETGLILPIGEWVLRTACAQGKKWHDIKDFPKIKISVNISVKQFRQPNFISLVSKILEETMFPAALLELEITESLILGNVTEVIQKMVELKALGVRFAIDDFGTGYSSLSYLKHFPFDTIKIDKSFMDNITNDNTNASIVEAIIGMTKRMDMDVLAEGVEYAEQVAYLREHHINQVQGYYFSKPLSEQACMELLKKDHLFQDIPLKIRKMKA